MLALVYLSAYLDRANIGNAASAGMTTDLGLVGGELGSKLLVILSDESPFSC
jgi:hypothetical protein